MNMDRPGYIRPRAARNKFALCESTAMLARAFGWNLLQYHVMCIRIDILDASIWSVAHKAIHLSNDP